MIRLRKPTFRSGEVIDICDSGMDSSPEISGKLAASRLDLKASWDGYQNLASRRSLYLIAPYVDRLGNKIVVNQLTKSDLVKLYDQYFVPKSKPAREKVYDVIKNSAMEKCTYCGGIGVPRTLDHYLPKAKYPAFSVLPSNLIPACRDCNSEFKSDAVLASAVDQVIQPYFDQDILFDDQWISATYNGTSLTDPGVISYSFSPPSTWDETTVQRAGGHFVQFDIANRYGIEAAGYLAEVLAQICKMLNSGNSNDDVIESLLAPGVDTAPFPNHWRKSMYQALIGALPAMT